MKILLFILLLLAFQQGSACSCIGSTPLLEIAKSEFIATVKILNVAPDNINQYFNNIDIEIIDLYKGDEISSLKVSGSDSSCDMHTPKNSKWLIYANRYQDGPLKFGLCSLSKQIDKEFNAYYSPNSETIYNQRLEKELQLLNFLKDEKINIINEFNLFPYMTKDCLKDFNGIAIKTNRFALYELTLDSDLNVKMITSIKKFEHENAQKQLQEKLLSCVNENMIVIKNSDAIEVPDNTKLMMGLYFNSAIDGDESYISSY